MRIVKLIAPALLVFTLIAGTVTGAAAQDEDAPLQLEDLDGIQQAVSRTFFVDSVATEGTPAPTQDGWLGLVTMAFAFDSEDAAAQAAPRLSADLERENFAGEDGTTEEIQLDIEREHVGYLMQSGADDGPMTFLVVIAQEGPHIDIVMGVTQGADPEPVVTETLAGMGDAEIGDGEGTFRADGTSEGGLWDKLPDAETVSAELPGPFEVEDEIVYPATSSPVAASTPVSRTAPVIEGTPAG